MAVTELRVGDQVGACLDVIFHRPLRRFYHEMNVEGSLCQSSNRFDDRWTKGEIRNIVSVHYVDVNPVGSGLIQRDNGFTESGKIG